MYVIEFPRLLSQTYPDPPLASLPHSKVLSLLDLPSPGTALPLLQTLSSSASSDPTILLELSWQIPTEFPFVKSLFEMQEGWGRWRVEELLGALKVDLGGKTREEEEKRRKRELALFVAMRVGDGVESWAGEDAGRLKFGSLALRRNTMGCSVFLMPFLSFKITEEGSTTPLEQFRELYQLIEEKKSAPKPEESQEAGQYWCHSIHLSHLGQIEWY